MTFIDHAIFSISLCMQITLYCNLNDIEEGSVSLDNELNYVSDWLACNKLWLNVNKTKFIVFIVSVKIWSNNINNNKTLSKYPINYATMHKYQQKKYICLNKIKWHKYVKAFQFVSKSNIGLFNVIKVSIQI